MGRNQAVGTQEDRDYGKAHVKIYVPFDKEVARVGELHAPTPLSQDTSSAVKTPTWTAIYLDSPSVKPFGTFVNQSFTIYLVGHCGPGIDFLANMANVKDSRAKTASIPFIIADLVKKGLDKGSTVKLKVFACHSSSKGPNNEPSFADHLAEALTKEGFQCSVYGYHDFMSMKWHDPEPGAGRPNPYKQTTAKGRAKGVRDQTKP